MCSVRMVGSAGFIPIRRFKSSSVPLTNAQFQTDLHMIPKSLNSPGRSAIKWNKMKDFCLSALSEPKRKLQSIVND